MARSLSPSSRLPARFLPSSNDAPAPARANVSRAPTRLRSLVIAPALLAVFLSIVGVLSIGRSQFAAAPDGRHRERLVDVKGPVATVIMSTSEWDDLTRVSKTALILASYSDLVNLVQSPTFVSVRVLTG